MWIPYLMFFLHSMQKEQSIRREFANTMPLYPFLLGSHTIFVGSNPIRLGYTANTHVFNCVYIHIYIYIYIYIYWILLNPFFSKVTCAFLPKWQCQLESKQKPRLPTPKFPLYSTYTIQNPMLIHFDHKIHPLASSFHVEVSINGGCLQVIRLNGIFPEKKRPLLGIHRFRKAPNIFPPCPAEGLATPP